MNKLLLFLIGVILIISFQFLSCYQMRNSDTVDLQEMQRYAEWLNATGQLNSYDRR